MAWVAGVGLAQGVRRSLADAPVPVLEELHDRRDAGGRVLAELAQRIGCSLAHVRDLVLQALRKHRRNRGRVLARGRGGSTSKNV